MEQLNETFYAVQQPEGPLQLIILLHGYGADASDLLPLGTIFANAFPKAYIVSLRAPQPSEAGAGASGFQWFSLADIEEGVGPNSRVPRVAAALPDLAARIQHWQQQSGLGHEATMLVGFSQGAQMALEYAHTPQAATGRVVALSGRFAALPETPQLQTTFHFFHGKEDPVIPYGFCVEAAKHLVALGADVTAEVLPFVGHEINADIVTRLLQLLQTHVPKRVWEAAMQADPEAHPTH